MMIPANDNAPSAAASDLVREHPNAIALATTRTKRKGDPENPASNPATYAAMANMMSGMREQPVPVTANVHHQRISTDSEIARAIAT
jgi:hypothetical protein